MSDKIEIFSTSSLIDLKLQLETAPELTDQQKDDFLNAIIELVEEFEKYMLDENSLIEQEIIERYMFDESYDPLSAQLEQEFQQQLRDAAHMLINEEVDNELEEDYYLAETKVPYLKVSRKACDSELET